jgi:hypothetical protein
LEKDWTMLCESKSFRKLKAVYSDPWSEWNMSPYFTSCFLYTLLKAVMVS